MKQITYSSNIDTKIDVIPSKSIILRVLTAIYLSGEKSKIINRSGCEDEKSALRLLRDLGVRIETDGYIQFEEFTKNIKRNINFGESGFLTRTFSLILVARDMGFKVEGTGSLKKRRFDDLLKVLRKLDVNVKSFNSKLPFKISGPLIKKNISIDC